MNDKQIWNINIIMPNGEIAELQWNTSLSASEICKYFEGKKVNILKLERVTYIINKTFFINPNKIMKESVE